LVNIKKFFIVFRVPSVGSSEIRQAGFI
jgi:hypothetical protein